jgi:ABC-type uncharacterized transport system permease subunit
MMALNPIMGDQHRMQLDFVAGAGFVGIAVALMGRSHPVGIVPAAILFGMLYQGGAEISFEMPQISRDMITIIQGLVILFAGALENMFRPAITAFFATLVRGSLRQVHSCGGVMIMMEYFDTLIVILQSTVRVSVPLILAALAGLYSERSGIFDIGLEGKMLAAAFAGGAAAAVTGSALIGLAAAIFVSVCLALVHGFASITQRGNQIVSGVAINFIALGATVILGQAWFRQGGTDTAIERGRPLLPRSSFPLPQRLQHPGHRLDLLEPSVGSFPSDLSGLCAGSVHLVGALPHPLWPAAAGRGRESRRGRYGRYLGHLVALPGSDLLRHPLRHRRRLSVDGHDRRLRQGNDCRQGFHRACGA